MNWYAPVMIDYAGARRGKGLPKFILGCILLAMTQEFVSLMMTTWDGKREIEMLQNKRIQSIGVIQSGCVSMGLSATWMGGGFDGEPVVKLNDASNEAGSNDVRLQWLFLIQSRGAEGRARNHLPLSLTHTHVLCALTHYKTQTHGQWTHMWLCAPTLWGGNAAPGMKWLHTLLLQPLFGSFHSNQKENASTRLFQCYFWQVSNT